MSDLRRLVDDGEAEPQLARLFRRGRSPAPLPEVVFERSRRRVLRLAAAPAALGVVVLLQYAALGVALGATTALVVAWPRLTAEQPATSRTLPSSSSAGVQRTARISEPAPPSSASVLHEPASSPSLARNAAPVTKASEHDLVRETKLLERARAELERQPGFALELLGEHVREFPQGALAIERDFLTVASLLRMGRRTEAEAHAAALRKRAPGSLYEERLERILRSGETP